MVHNVLVRYGARARIAVGCTSGDRWSRPITGQVVMDASDVGLLWPTLAQPCCHACPFKWCGPCGTTCMYGALLTVSGSCGTATQMSSAARQQAAASQQAKRPYRITVCALDEPGALLECYI